MNISTETLAHEVKSFLINLAKMTAICATDCAKHGRGGSVSMQIKCTLDETGNSVHALMVLKIKHPTGTLKDETATTEPVEVGSWKIGEDEGQQQIGGEG